MISKYQGVDGDEFLSLSTLTNSDVVYNNLFKPLEL